MSVMSDDDDMDSPRRRQASADAIAGRDAAVLVRQLNKQLGMWQASSIKLHTMAERLRATGRADPSVVEEAHTLFHVVSAEVERFESLLPTLPAPVANHGRISDTRRSFTMVVDRLHACLQLLGTKPGAE